MADENLTIRLIVQKSNAEKNLRNFQGDVRGMGNQVQRSSRQSTSAMASLKSSAQSYLGMAGVAGIAAGTSVAVASAFSRMQEKGSEFEQQLANLSAITGITGGALDELAEQALNDSTRYGEAASNIVEAQKLVASQLAEKIDFKTAEGLDQLKAVSEQAIVLQKAAGIDLRTAVGATTKAINQFDRPAEDASEIINVLAAGAKRGAGEVDFLSQALEEAGIGAAGAGESINTTVAALEILAKNGIDAAKSGTGLRNVFTILQGETQKLAEQGIHNLNIEQDGLIESLRKAKPLLDDAAGLNKVFGREVANTARALLTNVDSIEKMRSQISGTNTAYEQAETQINTYEGAVKQLSATFDETLLRAFRQSNGVMVEGIHLLTDLIETTGDWLEQPAAERVQEEMNQLNALVAEYRNANVSSERRSEIMSTLQDQYPEFLESIDIETASQRDLTKALNEANSAYDKRIARAAESEKLTDIQERLTEHQRNRSELQQKFYEQLIRLEEDYGVQVETSGKTVDEIFQQLKTLASAGEISFGPNIADGISNTYDLLDRKASQVTHQQDRLNEQIQLTVEALRKQEVPQQRINELVSDYIRDIQDFPNLQRALRNELRNTLASNEELTESEKQRAQELVKILDLQDGLLPQQEEMIGLRSKDAEESRKQSESDKTLSKRIDELKQANNELINQSEPLTDAHIKELRNNQKLIDKYQQLREEREKLMNYQPADVATNFKVGEVESADVESMMPSEDIGSEQLKLPKVDTVEYEVALTRAAELRKQLSQENQRAANAETAAERHAAQQSIQSIRQQIRWEEQKAQMIAGSTAKIAGSLADLMQQVGASAEAVKAAALIEVAANSAKAVSAAVAQASQVPFPANIPAIASAVAAVMSGVTQAYALLNQSPDSSSGNEQERGSGRQRAGFASGGQVPVAVSNGEYQISPANASRHAGLLHNINADPKVAKDLATTAAAQSAATGGMIRGAGSGTSDSIHKDVEPGTYIVNAKSTEAAKPLLDAIEKGERSEYQYGGIVTHNNNAEYEIQKRNSKTVISQRPNTQSTYRYYNQGGSVTNVKRSEYRPLTTYIEHKRVTGRAVPGGAGSSQMYIQQIDNQSEVVQAIKEQTKRLERVERRVNLSLDELQYRQRLNSQNEELQ